jgi:hypothetical protein
VQCAGNHLVQVELLQFDLASLLQQLTQVVDDIRGALRMSVRMS